MKSLNTLEKSIIAFILKKVRRGNVDNISRTMAYQNYYDRNREIWWALLASMVSRNAGWNMTDLESNWYQRMLPHEFRKTLFLTYERANWLIFSDAYPQLLIYEASKYYDQPLFHLLQKFHVSEFMQQEWERFYTYGEIERLSTALIINEQHLIQAPVIEHPFYSSHVFDTKLYFIHENLHFSNVLFPTMKGKLLGIYVNDFTNVGERIKLGKQLLYLLFKHHVSKDIHEFAHKAEYTGSRRDYEKYVCWRIEKKTPMLRMTYPYIHHTRHDYTDWSRNTKGLEKYFEDIRLPRRIDITNWYKHKLAELYFCMTIEEFIISHTK